MNFYNIINHDDDSEATVSADSRFTTKYMQTNYQDALSQLMNGPVKKALHIPSNVTWGGLSIGNFVFVHFKTNFCPAC